MQTINKITTWLAGVRKAIVATGNFLLALGMTLEDGVITQQEWIILAGAFLAIFGVYQATNLVGTVYRKK